MLVSYERFPILIFKVITKSGPNGIKSNGVSFPINA